MIENKTKRQKKTRFKVA